MMSQSAIDSYSLSNKQLSLSEDRYLIPTLPGIDVSNVKTDFILQNFLLLNLDASNFLMSKLYTVF
ncbi:hypothetical protein Cha6605_1991 [Chamaesiphon minutus PCC 6605]|uniref:Uncharacterized protein n=1 Tax=Chamaesiphon minutus (strain ATCC 27169 / PCC 6605) TaxID=1173020 RepID=K9UF79_CHAP6|nr:hypothetical protein Cha6605_1991 [Chamaesiphon minutus PCC 6605]